MKKIIDVAFFISIVTFTATAFIIGAPLSRDAENGIFGRPGQNVHGNWRFVEKSSSSDFCEYIFETFEGKKVVIRFTKRDPGKPSFFNSKDYNVTYVNVLLDEGEKKVLTEIIEDIIRHDRVSLPGEGAEFAGVFDSCKNVGIRQLFEEGDGGRVCRWISFFSLIFIVFLTAAWDIAAIGRKRGSPPAFREGAEIVEPREKTTRPGVIDFFLALAVARAMYMKITAGSLRVYLHDDLTSFPPPGVLSSPVKVIHYILSDAGMPDLSYRFLLALLSGAPGATAIIHFISIIFSVLALLLSYILAVRYVRRRLAWIVPLALVTQPIFYYLIIDIRGYAYFIFAGLLSVYAFDNMRRSPGRRNILVWFVCSVVAFTSNPILAALFPAMAIYYLLGLRTRLTAAAKRTLDIHFACLAAGVAVYATIPLDAAFLIIRTGTPESQQASAAARPFLYYLVCIALFTICAIAARKNFRSIIFWSYSFLAGTTFLLFLLDVLPVLRHYLIILMPFNFICVGMLLEYMVSLKPFKKKYLDASLTAVSIALICLSMAFYMGRESNFSKSFFIDEEDIEEAYNHIDAAAKNGELVLIYPDHLFSRFLTYRYGADPFQNNPLYNSAMGVKYLDCEQTMLRKVDRNYTVDAQDKTYPREVFEKTGFVMIIGEEKIPPALDKHRDCVLDKRYERSNINVWACMERRPASEKKD